MKNFNYFAPSSMTELLGLLRHHRDAARILAGGTDLLVQMKRRAITPPVLISARNLANLDQVTAIGTDGLLIGAFATLTDLLDNPIASPAAQFLASISKRMAGPSIRNNATLGGNLCNASPSADMATGLIVLGATVTLLSEIEERTLPAEAFFVGPGQSVLKPEELMVRVDVPDTANRFCDYQRLSVRKAIDIAIVGIAASAIGTADGLLTQVRIAAGAVAPVPMRAHQAEALLEKQEWTDALIEDAAATAAAESSPISDVRASAGYRREMVAVLTRRALKTVRKNAGKEVLSP